MVSARLLDAVVAGLAAALFAPGVRARPLVTAPPSTARSWPRPSRRSLLVGASLALALLSPPLGLVVPVGAAGRQRLRARSVERALRRDVTRALPDAVDLFLLGCGAGLSLPLAHDLVSTHLPAPLGPALRAARHDVSVGRARAEALLDALEPLGDRALALAHVLADHLRYGVPLAPGLERLGLELRLDRRRAAEEAARRVPVRLLAPLVSCTLPAFGLLTVVPLLVASLRALPT